MNTPSLNSFIYLFRFFAGLFGVGGGAVTVPALTLCLGVSHYQVRVFVLYVGRRRRPGGSPIRPAHVYIAYAHKPEHIATPHVYLMYTTTHNRTHRTLHLYLMYITIIHMIKQNKTGPGHLPGRHGPHLRRGDLHPPHARSVHIYMIHDVYTPFRRDQILTLTHLSIYVYVTYTRQCRLVGGGPPGLGVPRRVVFRREGGGAAGAFCLCRWVHSTCTYIYTLTTTHKTYTQNQKVPEKALKYGFGIMMVVLGAKTIAAAGPLRAAASAASGAAGKMKLGGFEGNWAGLMGGVHRYIDI